MLYISSGSGCGNRAKTEQDNRMPEALGAVLLCCQSEYDDYTNDHKHTRESISQSIIVQRFPVLSFILGLRASADDLQSHGGLPA